MPYSIKRSGSGFKVHSPNRAFSKKPLSKKKAQAQMRAIYANTGGESLEQRLSAIFDSSQPLSTLTECEMDVDELEQRISAFQRSIQHGKITDDQVKKIVSGWVEQELMSSEQAAYLVSRIDKLN